MERKNMYRLLSFVVAMAGIVAMANVPNGLTDSQIENIVREKATLWNRGDFANARPQIVKVLTRYAPRNNNQPTSIIINNLPGDEDYSNLSADLIYVCNSGSKLMSFRGFSGIGCAGAQVAPRRSQDSTYEQLCTNVKGFISKFGSGSSYPDPRLWPRGDCIGTSMGTTRSEGNWFNRKHYYHPRRSHFMKANLGLEGTGSGSEYAVVLVRFSRPIDDVGETRE